MFNIAVCEDNEVERRILLGIISHIVRAKGLQTTMDAYADGEDLVRAFPKKRYQLVFMDIVMDRLNGIETTKLLHELDAKSEIVFCTANREFAIEAHEVHAMGYLLKPYDAFRISAIIDYFLQKYPEYHNRTIMLKVQRRNKQLFHKDIICVESDNKILYFHMISQEKLKVYGKLDEMEQRLNDDTFLRCHKSFLINMRHIVGCNGTEFITLSNEHIPIRKNGRKELVECFDQYRMEELEKSIDKMTESIS